MSYSARSQQHRCCFTWLIVACVYSRVAAFGFQITFQGRNCGSMVFLLQNNVFQECQTIDCIEEQWVESRKTQLNATSVALKRTTQLFLAGQQSEAKNLLPRLLNSLDEQIMSHHRDEAYPVVAVTSSLISLSALMTSPYQGLDELQIDALVRRWWDSALAHRETFVATQKPHRLVKILRLALFLGLKEDALYNSVCNRLAQGDALGRIEVYELARTILSFSHQDREFAGEEIVLLNSYLRRLRKLNVRTELDRTSLVQSVGAIRKLLKLAFRFSLLDFTKELRVTYYTLTAEFMKATENSEDDAMSPSEAYLLWRVARDLILTPEDALRITILRRLEDNSKSLVQKATLRELALLSDVFLLSAKFKTTQIIRKVGQVLENDPGVVSGEVQPWIISSVLRYAVLDVPKIESGNVPENSSGLSMRLQPSTSSRSNELLVMPFSVVLLDLLQQPGFLLRTSADQISNFLWFLHSVRLYNKNVIFALGHRILDPEVSSSCSSKLACRLLGSFTSIFSFSGDWDESGNVDARQDLLASIFGALGEHLLSVNMSVVDISTALYAYGKASFVQDMGLFDHLATLMAERIGSSDETVTVRQVAQSLWACGKMSGFENAQEDEMEDQYVELPFEKAAFEMAHYLGTHSYKLTSRDVTQSLWAIGMLQILDRDIAGPLIRRSQDLVHELNTQEVANILLALSRIKSEEFKAVFDLTRRFTNVKDVALALPTTQEAANIIYSLGRLNIRDEEVFKYLTSILMENIEETSAQAVANVLWAHRIVHIPPPRELLDRWTIKKLGLVSFQSRLEIDDCL